MLNLRRLTWVSLGLVALGSLAACGGAAPGEPPAQSTATTQPRVATAIASSPAPTQPASAAGSQAAAQTPTQQAPAALPATPTTAGSSTAEPGTEAATITPEAQAALPPATCTAGAVTPAQTEGPYYTENPPERSDLVEGGMAGTKLTVTGYVFTADCKPVPGARVDFWQADSQGRYDNAGYTLRGYQITGADGRYAVETVVPGLYPGRTRHIHVKVQAPGRPVLTTQLYFPGEQANSRDGILNSALIMDVQDTAQGKVGTFNFVLNTR